MGWVRRARPSPLSVPLGFGGLAGLAVVFGLFSSGIDVALTLLLDSGVTTVLFGCVLFAPLFAEVAGVSSAFSSAFSSASAAARVSAASSFRAAAFLLRAG